MNYFGPKHTGGLAFLVSVPTVIVVVLLGLFCLPHLGAAVHHLQPLTGGFFKNWKGFVGVVLALSGVEAIANSTGVMKLNPGSTDANPNVSKTSTPRHSVGDARSLHFHRVAESGHARAPGLVPSTTTDVTAMPMAMPRAIPACAITCLRYMGAGVCGRGLGAGGRARGGA